MKKLTPRIGNALDKLNLRKHIFVARTARSTTKEIVEGYLESLVGINYLCTSGEAFSLTRRKTQILRMLCSQYLGSLEG